MQGKHRGPENHTEEQQIRNGSLLSIRTTITRRWQHTMVERYMIHRIVYNSHEEEQRAQVNVYQVRTYLKVLHLASGPLRKVPKNTILSN